MRYLIHVALPIMPTKSANCADLTFRHGSLSESHPMFELSIGAPPLSLSRFDEATGSMLGAVNFSFDAD